MSEHHIDLILIGLWIAFLAIIVWKGGGDDDDGCYSDPNASRNRQLRRLRREQRAQRRRCGRR